MKNYWGQEIAIGSTVGVGYSGATWHQLGVVVKLEEKPEVSWRPERKFWAASVIWVSDDRGGRSWYDGPVFQSQYPAADLLVIDDSTIDPVLFDALADAYAEWIFTHSPEPFIAPTK